MNRFDLGDLIKSKKLKKEKRNLRTKMRKDIGFVITLVAVSYDNRLYLEYIIFILTYLICLRILIS